MVGLRLAGETRNGSLLVAVYLSELRAADGAKILTHRLFGKGKRTLTRFIAEFGADATIDTIKGVLTRAMIDGTAPRSVTTWSYFRPAIAEQVALNRMMAAGLRPGDCLGMHRAYLRQPQLTRRIVWFEECHRRDGVNGPLAPLGFSGYMTSGVNSCVWAYR